MRLNVNLIPALAYALVTMFFNLTGVKLAEEKNTNHSQYISQSVRHPKTGNHDAYILVRNNGQLILSTDEGNNGLVWKIPFTPAIKI